MIKTTKYALFILSYFIFAHAFTSYGQSAQQQRHAYLQQLLELQETPPSHDAFVSYHDSTWIDWVERTGALPPNFEDMPSIPLLPDPLVIDEGGENIPVETRAQWKEKREWIKEQAKHILSGTFPPPPSNVTAHVLDEKMENGVKIEMIELRFGNNKEAKLTLELFTPPGDGPFPVFMTQWNHRGWAQIAVRRGYMGLVYAGADDRDDTREYLELYPDYDWSTLMARAWGAHRAVDYLYTLDRVDRSQIAITGHSRNAKQSVFAGAFDDRITAVISSSGGTGGEIPYRYTDARHSNEEIEFLVSRRTHWLHPRLRFYWGREHKLPIDQNSLLSLIAPNSLLLSTSIRENKAGGAPWAIEHNYQSLEKVYGFLDAGDKLGIRFRDGEHAVEARDIEAFIDWLDIQFDRSSMIPWENELVYNYSFDQWKELSGETVDPRDFPVIPAERAILTGEGGATIDSPSAWKAQKDSILADVDWLLGDRPAGVTASPIRRLTARDDYLNSFISRPEVSNGRSRNIAPYNALGDYLHGRLYYPTDEDGEMQTGEEGKLPVVIYLHRFSNTGFDATNVEGLFEDILSEGMAVLAMDLIGYGTRIEEGTLFYERYPHWSKLGKMVTDTRAAVDALEGLEFVDRDQIFLSGFALGGTVSLFTAALDDRIAGVGVSGAFTPLRDASGDVEGVKTYSHLHGLLPRLGFFVDDTERIPVDFPAILASIAPRPMLVITPELDRHSDFKKVQQAVGQAETVYRLFNSDSKLDFMTPYEFTGFSSLQKKKLVDWLHGQLKQ
ncbi:glucuronyl esterase domain-containing protein [Fodinibius sediminis]|uniref:Acetyl xylan esterase (AXE1) n=1 Tax=Fodinibius sediminis TaxID=1214077 RepID=A0A521CTK2_9BACT|nr:acetylxylan esterase [Fodinibius sediminis]SMO62743.1 Acetyl xylan esterase (AXE1) [Fodinibius sediminis]